MAGPGTIAVWVAIRSEFVATIAGTDERWLFKITVIVLVCIVVVEVIDVVVVAAVDVTSGGIMSLSRFLSTLCSGLKWRDSVLFCSSLRR